MRSIVWMSKFPYVPRISCALLCSWPRQDRLAAQKQPPHTHLASIFSHVLPACSSREVAGRPLVRTPNKRLGPKETNYHRMRVCGSGAPLSQVPASSVPARVRPGTDSSTHGPLHCPRSHHTSFRTSLLLTQGAARVCVASANEPTVGNSGTLQSVFLGDAIGRGGASFSGASMACHTHSEMSQMCPRWGHLSPSEPPVAASGVPCDPLGSV